MQAKFGGRFALCAIALTIATACSDLGKTSDDHYQLAIQHYQLDDTDSAIIELKNSIKKDAQHVQSRKLLGAIYYHDALYEQAEKELSIAQRLSPADAEVELLIARIALATENYLRFDELLAETDTWPAEQQASAAALKIELLMLKGEQEEAELALDMAAGLPENKDMQYVNALIASSHQQFSIANDYLDDALASDKQFIKAYLLKGRIALFLKEFADAKKNFQQAADLQQNNNLLKMNVVRVLVAENDYDTAAKRLQVINRLAPEYPEANYFTAFIALKKEDFNQAYLFADKVLQVVSNHTPSQYVKASAAYSLERYEQALQAINKVVADRPNHVDSIKLLAAVQLKLNMEADAINTLAKLTEQDFSEKDVSLLYAASNAAFKEGYRDQNQLFLRNIRAINKDEAQPDIRTALYQLENQEVAASIESIKSALSKDPSSKENRILLIATLISKQSYSEAQSELDTYTQSHGDDVNSLVLQGIIYIETDNQEQAKAVLQEALALDPGNVNASHNLAVVYLRNKDLAMAKDIYLAAVAINKDSYKVLHQLYSIDLSLDYPNAAKWLIQAEESGYSDLWVSLPLAEHLYLHQKYQESANYIAAHKGESQSSYRLAVLLAQLARVERNIEQAQEYLVQAITKKPEKLFPRYWLSKNWESLGQLNQAFDAISKLLQIEPNHIISLDQKFSLAIKLRRVEDAKQGIKKLLELEPERRKTKQLNAYWLLLQGENERSIALYRELFETRKNNQSLLGLSRALVSSGKELEAVVLMEEWLEQHPNDSLTLSFLANYYLSNDEKSKALKKFSLLVKLAPNNALALNNLAYLQFENGNIEQAFFHAKTANDILPNQAFILDTLGQVQLANNKNKQALESLSRAVQLAPNNLSFKYHKANAQIANQLIDDAIELLQAIVDSKSVNSQSAHIKVEAENRLEQLQGTSKS